jgi:hypothetical protein
MASGNVYIGLTYYENKTASRPASGGRKFEHGWCRADDAPSPRKFLAVRTKNQVGVTHVWVDIQGHEVTCAVPLFGRQFVRHARERRNDGGRTSTCLDLSTTAERI